MKSAIILLENKKAKEKALKPLLDRKVIDFIIYSLKEAGTENVLVVTDLDIKIDDAIVCKELYTAIKLINTTDSEVIILDDIYPFISIDTYKKLYEMDNVYIDNTKIIKLNINNLVNINSIELNRISCDELLDIDLAKNYHILYDYWHHLINQFHEDNGVIIIDSNSTYIGPDVKIERGVIIEANVTIYGNSYIGKNNILTNGTYLENVYIGNDNKIISSRITDSIVHNKNTIGPYAHLRNKTEVFDETRIGNFVEFKNTIFQNKSRCAHLTYLGDAKVGEDVNIGCGVITANYDGAHKFHTIIGDHTFVGSNSNLIAPVKIGNYVLIAAGSTVTSDIDDNDMVIARSRQVIKEGYGYRYINKER